VKEVDLMKEISTWITSIRTQFICSTHDSKENGNQQHRVWSPRGREDAVNVRAIGKC